MANIPQTRSSPQFFRDRRKMDLERQGWLPFEIAEAEASRVDVETDKDLDADTGDSTGNSDPNSLSLPELEFTMNGSKDRDEDVDEEDDEEDEDVEDVEDEDDIHMDEEVCDDELGPQFKKKKTK